MLKTENCINNRVNNKLTAPKYLRLSHLPLATTKESETRESQACHYLNSLSRLPSSLHRLIQIKQIHQLNCINTQMFVCFQIFLQPLFDLFSRCFRLLLYFFFFFFFEFFTLIKWSLSFFFFFLVKVAYQC